MVVLANFSRAEGGSGFGDREETTVGAELIRTLEAECLLFGLGQSAPGEGYK